MHSEHHPSARYSAWLADRRGLPPMPGAIGVLANATLVGLTAIKLRALQPGAASSAPLVMLVADQVAAVAFGFWTGLLAAVLTFGALNYLFTAPLYTVHIARPRDLFALMVFLLLAALVGLLSGRLHDRAEAAQSRAEALGILGALSTDLANAETRPAALSAARSQPVRQTL